jgi:DNA polymerase-3 subunit delta
MQNYSAMKTMLVIGKIRETDAKLKGVGRGNASDLDIMKELIYYIMH